MSVSELEQIQREHVIDWLISNHDAHGKQFLRLKSGYVKATYKSIRAIDPPEVDPEANAVYREWKAFQEANPWLSEITSQQREEFLSMVKRAMR